MNKILSTLVIAAILPSSTAFAEDKIHCAPMPQAPMRVASSTNE